jgi:hypothetical protein
MLSLVNIAYPAALLVHPGNRYGVEESAMSRLELLASIRRTTQNRDRDRHNR